MSKEEIISTLASFGITIVKLEEEHNRFYYSYRIKLGDGQRYTKLLRYSKDIAQQLGQPNNLEIRTISKDSDLLISIGREDVKPLIVSGKSINNEILPIILGKSFDDTLTVCDLANMPHLLVGGQTGSGKTSFLKNVITTLKDKVNFTLIDLKGTELVQTVKETHLVANVRTDPLNALNALQTLVRRMNLLYDEFKRSGCKDFAEFNKSHQYKYEVLIIDELADLMLSYKNDAERLLVQIAQKGRAAGIHMILATQRPSVQIVTGLIKANLPARISFALPTAIDSRVILDMKGAEQLRLKGQALYKDTYMPQPLLIQTPYLVR